MENQRKREHTSFDSKKSTRPEKVARSHNQAEAPNITTVNSHETEREQTNMLSGENRDFSRRTRQEGDALKTHTTSPQEQGCKSRKGKEVSNGDVGGFSAPFPLKLPVPCNSKHGILSKES